MSNRLKAFGALHALTAVAVVLGVVAGSGALAAPASATAQSVAADTVGVGPKQSNFLSADLYAHPEAAPQGANNWRCRPSARHPRPVILVHGTFESAYQTWAGLSPVLADDGFCVFAPNLGILAATDGGGVHALTSGGSVGAGPVDRSARQLAVFVRRVQTATGAAHVDLVGHSQGGIIIRQYLKFYGGATVSDPAVNRVSRVVTIVATNHGTTLDGLVTLQAQLAAAGINAAPAVSVVAGAAGVDQEVGSPFLATLNKGGDTVPGVDYTVIASRYDEVTTPYWSTFLRAGPDARVVNVLLQNGCPGDLTDHLDATYSPRVQSLVARAVGSQQPLRCVARI